MKTQHLLTRLERLPMLRALAPFAAGILLAEHYTLPLWFLTGAFVCAGAIALLMRSPWAVVAMLCTAGFGLRQLQHRETSVPVGVRTAWEVVIEGIPSDRRSYTVVDARIRAWRNPHSGHWHAADDRVTLRADSLTAIHTGEILRCTGRIRPLRGEQSFRSLMTRRGYAGTFFLSGRGLLERLPASSSSLHTRAVERMAGLKSRGDAQAVIRAMSIGDRSSITPELRSHYARSGFSHLLALSGLHTGIVFALVNAALWWLPLLRRGHLWRNLLAAAAIWCFVAAAGWPPSAVRAATMCTLLQFSLASSSEYNSLNTLAVAAFAMLLWNPAWIGDISFQLSFAAVAGILAWGVPLCRRLQSRWRALNAATNALAISLAASVATLPLVAHTFGVIPVAGILINPLAILLATVVVLTGALWLLMPLQILATPLGWIATQAAEGLNALARCVAELPGGAPHYTLETAPTAAVYLLMIAATLAAWSREPKKSLSLFR